MKNSKNKILAAAVCGVIAGSVGTSIIGNFQAKEELNSNTVDNSSISSNKDNIVDNSENSNTESNQKPIKGEGNRGGHKGEASLESTESIDVTSGQYSDGTYEGSASGYASGLKVQVEIVNGKISDVQVVSHNETPGFCERAIEIVPAEIIENQSTDVDTVSRATYTSKGIINAVNDALSNADNSTSSNILNNNVNI